MKLEIGEKIKTLRQKLGISQERLSEMLGVSAQSVSRWETDICYPDVELLPVIANCFDVTLDELMGMDALRSVSRKNEIFNRVFVCERNGSWTDAIHVLRDALRVYPTDEGLTAELALALTRTGDPRDRVEAISVSERLLGSCENEKLCSTVRANLCMLYKTEGLFEHAEALGRTLPHIWESREVLLPLIVSDERAETERRRSFSIAEQVLNTTANGEEILFSLGFAPKEETGEKLLSLFGSIRE